MKSIKLKIKLLSLMMLCAVIASAKDVTVDNVKYQLNDDGTATIIDAKKAIDFVIPETVQDQKGDYYKVTSIDPKAVNKSKDIKSVTFNGQIKEIPKSTFDGCKNLTSIDLKGVETIQDKAFYNTEIESVNIPISVKNLGKEVFRNRLYGSFVKVMTIDESDDPINICDLPYIEIVILGRPFNVTSESSYFFGYPSNKSIKRIEFGKNVHNIPEKLFDEYPEIEVISIKSPKLYTELDSKTFDKGKKRATWASAYGVTNDQQPFANTQIINPRGEVLHSSRYEDDRERFMNMDSERHHEFLNKQKNGTAIRTDNLPNGITCTHYQEGYRVYSKPNGDYISYKEPEDKRDTKTMNMVKGIDQELPEDYDGMIAYKITLPGGAIMEQGLYLDLKFPNNTELKYCPDSSTENEGYKVPLDVFLNPTNSFIFDVFSDCYYNRGFYYLSGIDGVDEMVSNCKEGVFNKGSQLYKISPEKGFYIYGVAMDSSQILVEPSKIKEIGDEIVFFENGDLFYYANIFDENKKFDQYARLTLKDGTVYESFIDGKNANRKLTLADGSKFIYEPFDKISADNELCKISSYNDSISFSVKNLFGTGTYFDANGNETAYINGMTAKEHQEMEAKAAKEKAAKEAKANAEIEKVVKKFYAKYGKTNVDNAANGKINVGMSINMFKELGGIYSVVRDSQTQYSTWYVIKYYLMGVKFSETSVRVNNKTGKIDLVGSTSTVL